MTSSGSRRPGADGRRIRWLPPARDPSLRGTAPRGRCGFPQGDRHAAASRCNRSARARIVMRLSRCTGTEQEQARRHQRCLPSQPPPSYLLDGQQPRRGGARPGVVGVTNCCSSRLACSPMPRVSRRRFDGPGRSTVRGIAYRRSLVTLSVGTTAGTPGAKLVTRSADRGLDRPVAGGGNTGLLLPVGLRYRIGMIEVVVLGQIAPGEVVGDPVEARV